jgi:hypothetical protein
MVDQLLSRGLIEFLGTPGQVEEKSPEARVADVVGDAAVDLLPRIQALLDEVYAPELRLWEERTVGDIADRVSRWLRAHHPELSDDAINAVSNQFAFDWK